MHADGFRWRLRLRGTPELETVCPEQTLQDFQHALVGSFANMTAMPQRHVPERLGFRVPFPGDLVKVAELEKAAPYSNRPSVSSSVCGTQPMKLTWALNPKP